jgi:hypothetical protein
MLQLWFLHEVDQLAEKQYWLDKVITLYVRQTSNPQRITACTNFLLYCLAFPLLYLVVGLNVCHLNAGCLTF